MTCDLLYATDGNAATPVVGVKLSSVAPFSVSTSVTNLSTFPTVVTVETTAGSSTTVNEVQTVVVQPATGGTFTLTWNGHTTSALAYNCAASDVQAALVALTGIGSGQVVVTGLGTPLNPFVVTFQGTLAATNVASISGTGTNLTGAASAFAFEIQAGASARNQVQRIPTGYNQQLTWGPFTSLWSGVSNGNFSGISDPAIAASIGSWWATRSAAAGPIGAPFLSSLIGTRFNVKNVSNTGGTGYIDIEFIGPYANANWPLFSVYSGGVLVSSPGQPTVIQGAGPINEVQLLSLIGSSLGGTFTVSLTYSAMTYTSSGIAYNATAATLQANLAGLPNIGGNTSNDSTSNVMVTGSAGGPYTVTFQNALGNLPIPLLVLNATALTGGSITCATTQDGSSTTVNEVQTVTISNAVGGTFSLAFGAYATTNLAYNASANTVQAALAALTSIGGNTANDGTSNIKVTGSAGGPYTLTYQNTLGAFNQPLMLTNATLLVAPVTEALVATTVSTATGPNFWDNPNNWLDSTGATGLPVSGDHVYVQDSAISILYGLNQSAVTLADLNIDSSFTGEIGLRHINPKTGFVEFNPEYLSIGATLIELGRGDGSGTKLCKINTGSAQTTFRIDNTGTATDANPVVIWKGTHASNAIYLAKGYFGAAIYAGEVATISVLDSTLKTNKTSDCKFLLGDGVTLGTLNKVGGSGKMYCTGTTIINRDGDLDITQRSALTISQLTIDAGIVTYQGIGTITEADVSGVLDMRQDSRPRTIGQLNCYAGGEFHDPLGTVTHSSAPKLIECSPATFLLDLPINMTLTYTAL